jgi:hypothetical protein
MDFFFQRSEQTRSRWGKMCSSPLNKFSVEESASTEGLTNSLDLRFEPSQRWVAKAGWGDAAPTGRSQPCTHSPPPARLGPNCPLGQANLGSHPTWESFELFLSPCPTPSHSTLASSFSSLAASLFSDVYPKRTAMQDLGGGRHAERFFQRFLRHMEWMSTFTLRVLTYSVCVCVCVCVCVYFHSLTVVCISGLQCH